MAYLVSMAEIMAEKKPSERNGSKRKNGINEIVMKMKRKQLFNEMMAK
jgi:hypothetical protein